MSKEKELLEAIAIIAHSGGLINLSAETALIRIRGLTINHIPSDTGYDYTNKKLGDAICLSKATFENYVKNGGYRND